MSFFSSKEFTARQGKGDLRSSADARWSQQWVWVLPSCPPLGFAATPSCFRATLVLSPFAKGQMTLQLKLKPVDMVV